MNPRITKLKARPAILLALALFAVAAPASAQITTSEDPVRLLEMPVMYLAWPPEDPDPVPWVRSGIQNRPHAVMENLEKEASDGFVSVAAQPELGRILAAWARRSGNGCDVVLSRFESGAWSEPVVLAGSSADERDPALAIGPDSTVHVLYWVSGGRPRVMHRQAPSDLSVWSEPAQVSAPREPACRPRAVFHEGVLSVAYEAHDFGFGNTPKRIVLSRLDDLGFAAETVAVTSYAGPARPEVRSQDGRLWVEWTDAPGELAWALADSRGAFEPPRREPFSNAMERDVFARQTIRYKALLDPTGE